MALKTMWFQINNYALGCVLFCTVIFTGATTLAHSGNDDHAVDWGATVNINSTPDGAAYGRMIKLSDGSWLAVTTIFPPGRPSQLVFVSSADACRTWQAVTTLGVPDRKLDNGQLVQLRDGSVLVAMRSLIDGESYRLEVYRSADRGRSWHYLSTIDTNDDPHGRRDRGVWEPHLNVLADGRLAVMYANEKHADEKPSYNQVISQKVSNDHGTTWGPETVVVAEPAGGKLRPGMPVWTRMANGKWIVVYEIVNLNTDVHYKISRDGVTWAQGLGTRIAEQHCGPYVLSLIDGRLLVTSCQNEVSISDDYAETWQRVDPSPWTFGYSFSWASLYQVSAHEIAVMATMPPQEDRKSRVALRFGALLPRTRRH